MRPVPPGPSMLVTPSEARSGGIGYPRKSKGCVLGGFLPPMLDGTRACHFGFCDRLGPGRRVSPLFVSWAHEVSNERRAQVLPRRRNGRPGGDRTRTRPPTFGRTVGARVLRISRSGTVQLAHLPRAFLFIGSIARRNPLEHGAKVLLADVVLVAPNRYISRPTRPANPLSLGICCARLARFGGSSTRRLKGGASLPFSFTGRKIANAENRLFDAPPVSASGCWRESGKKWGWEEKSSPKELRRPPAPVPRGSDAGIRKPEGRETPPTRQGQSTRRYARHAFSASSNVMFSECLRYSRHTCRAACRDE